jgi:colanic acid/amylovoran biosynthesis protein
MRVLVLWADNRSSSLGVRVLAQGMAILARDAWGSETTVDFQDFAAGDSGMSLGGRSLARDFGRRRGPVKEKLRGYDVIIDSGAGDSLTDIYGLKRLVTIVATSRISKKLRIPVVMGPQTIGPFDSRIGTVLGRTRLQHAALVLSRDSQSANYAAKLGRQVDATVTDVVFCLPLPPCFPAQDIVVNVSGLLWAPNPHFDSVEYRHEVRELIRGLLVRSRRVALLPHVLQNPYADNDMPAMEDLESEFGNQVNSIVPKDLENARAILASASLTIGARMHACLNSLSVGTPTIYWAYSRKFAPMMEDIGWEFGVDLRSARDPARETLALVDLITRVDFEAKVASVCDAGRRSYGRAVSALENLTIPGR